MPRRKTHPRERGGMAVAIAAALPLLTVVSGAGVDYLQYADAKLQLQALADKGALAAAKKPEAPMEYMEQMSRLAVSSNLPKRLVLDPIQPPVLNGATAVDVTLSGTLKTTMMGVIGITTMKLSATATALRAKYGPLELAMALDYTWSMNDPPPGGGARKIDTMKAAALNLAQQVMMSNSAAVGVVPFAAWMNIGTRYNGEPWLDVPPTAYGWAPTYLGSTYGPDMCPADGGLAPCRHDKFDYTRLVPSAAPFRGCVALRPPAFQDDIYASPEVKYQGSLIDCSPVRPIVDLTKANDGGTGVGKSRITAAIQGLAAINHEYRVETLIPSGLTWGWNMLTSAKPLDKAMSKDVALQLGGRKVLLLMTDGSNSVITNAQGLPPATRLYAPRPASEIAAANVLTAKLCENIKKDGIIIYTVAFGIPDATTLKMLKTCASDDAHYFNAQDNDAMMAAFQDIGAQLVQVRLLN